MTLLPSIGPGQVHVVHVGATEHEQGANLSPPFARRAVGSDGLLRGHDRARMLKAGEPVKVVSERLGHASAMIPLGVYTHTLPGMQRDAANKLAAMVLGS